MTPHVQEYLILSSKLELLQDAAVNALDSLRDAVADLPADEVARTLAKRTESARRAAA